jgi:hypothetical protein
MSTQMVLRYAALIAALAWTSLVTNTTQGSERCALIGSAYSLVNDPKIELVFSLDMQRRNPQYNIAFALLDRGKQFLSGYITSSLGASRDYLESDVDGMDSVQVGYLDGNLRDTDQGEAVYLVAQTLTQALWYGARELLEEHAVNGTVWKRKTCGMGLE